MMAVMTDSLQPHPFRIAAENADRPAMLAALAPEIVLHSPVSFKPFVGLEAVDGLFAALLEVFKDFHYTDELPGPRVRILVFEARVGDRQLQGVDILRIDDAGLVNDFTVMVRPLSATLALAEAIGGRLAARHGG